MEKEKKKMYEVNIIKVNNNNFKTREQFNKEKEENKRQEIADEKKNDYILVKNDLQTISFFSSLLTRVVSDLEYTDLKEQIVVLERTFNPYDRTDNKNNDDILNNIFINGFYIADEKYIFFTSSSSQTKQMKLVFIKETIFEKYKTLFFNGLNLDDINTNLSKWLAYVSLCETSTREWKDFDIDKCIVVDDFEKNVTGTVDYIDDKKYSIKRENEKTIKMNINDGCGLILPTLSEKIITIRLPFFKGLLAPYPFYEHCKEAEKLKPFKDIDGKEWTYDKLIEKDIQIIFTKSQFKTWKLYGNKPFESYKEQYKKHEKEFKICLAGICLEEENEDEFKDKRINYQMLQTLIDMNQSDLEKLLKKTFEEIKRILDSQDKTINKIACGNESISKLLTKFPMLLGDDDIFDICRKKIKNIENRAKQGKFVISSKRVFILPDLYSFCNHLFCGTDTGLLEDGEISCNLFENEKVIDCLRSPQLYLEHAIRENVTNEKTKKWFCSNGLYTSTKDLISLVILNDYDGDEILAVGDSDYVELAKKHVEKYDVVPLYYKFGKAEEVDYSKENMLNAIRIAWKSNKVGSYSNDVTKVLGSVNISSNHTVGENDEEIKRNILNVVKLLAMENNKSIDSTKTGEEIKRTQKAKREIEKYTKKASLPYFMQYAKDKDLFCRDVKVSALDFIEDIIAKQKYNQYGIRNIYREKFRDSLDIKYMMRNSDKKYDKKVIEKVVKVYDLFNKKYYSMMEENVTYIDDIYSKCKSDIINHKSLEKVNVGKDDIINILVRYLFETQVEEKKNNSSVSLKCKKLFFFCFAQDILENVTYNIGNQFFCSNCGKLSIKTGRNQKECAECSKTIKKSSSKSNEKTM